MSVSRVLASWQWLLDTDGPRGLRQRIFGALEFTLLPQLMLVVVGGMMGAAALLSANLVEASNPANMSCGFYSCLGSNVVFYRRRRRRRALHILRHLRLVTEVVEKSAPDYRGVEEALARGHRMERRMTSLQVGFGAAMIGSVWMGVIATGRSYAPTWPPPPNDAADLAIGVAEMVTMMTGCTGFYAAGALIGCMATTLTALHASLAAQLGGARSEADLLRFVELHQRVIVLSRQVDELFCDSMMHYMLCCFSAPLISTLQLVHNDLHFLTFTAVFINLAVFMPMALLSQLLSDASVSVRLQAYHAAFEVDDGDVVRSRRVLLLVELLASRPASLTLKGLGQLSLGSAGNALRTWYSFTSLLVNSSGRA